MKKAEVRNGTDISKAENPLSEARQNTLSKSSRNNSDIEKLDAVENQTRQQD